MKPSTPIGNSKYGPLLVRVSLGAYFVLAGLAKLENPHLFITEIKNMGLLPDLMATLYGILLPYIEITAGALLIIGFWTILASFLSALMLISFIIALGLTPMPHTPFNKDIILLGAAISIMYSGAGALSIDRFRSAAG